MTNDDHEKARETFRADQEAAQADLASRDAAMWDANLRQALAQTEVAESVAKLQKAKANALEVTALVVAFAGIVGTAWAVGAGIAHVVRWFL